MILVVQADACHLPLADRSIQCVITSPPYWGLRQYSGVGEHGLGLEPTITDYVEHLCLAFDEVHRVLRDTGTVWLNLGDCYYHPTCCRNIDLQQRRCGDSHNLGNLASDIGTAPHRQRQNGLKQKDLVGLPWRVAFALQDRGWYLRSDIIWAKGVSFRQEWSGSVMPESVADRPTRAHEYLFLFTKQPKYLYWHEAVKEQGRYPAGTRAAKGSGTREGNRRGARKKDIREAEGERRQTGSFQDRWDDGGYAIYDGKRNIRDVWAIGTRPYRDAHFATFPEALVRPCIMAGTSLWECRTCHMPYGYHVEKEPIPADVKAAFAEARLATIADTGRSDGHTQRKPHFVRKSLGARWEARCSCGTEPVAQTVLDPFAGSGTVGLAARALERKAVLTDLSNAYCHLARRRLGQSSS